MNRVIAIALSFFYVLLCGFVTPGVMAESLNTPRFPGHRIQVEDFKKASPKTGPYQGERFPSDEMIIRSFKNAFIKTARLYFAGINVMGKYHTRDGTPRMVICTGLKPAPFNITIERNVHAQQWPRLSRYWDGGKGRLRTPLDCSSYEILRLDTGTWIMKTPVRPVGEHAIVIEK